MRTHFLLTRTSRTSQDNPYFIGSRCVPIPKSGTRTSRNRRGSPRPVSELSGPQETDSEHIKPLSLQARPTCPNCPGKKHVGA